MIWFIFCAGFVLRALFAVSLGQEIHFSDGLDYKMIADNLFKGLNYEILSGPTALRMPGYPYFLLICKFLSQYTVMYVLTVRFVQIGISLLTGYGLYMLSRSFFSKPVTRSVLCLYMISPQIILMPSFFLTETIFACLLFFGVFLFVSSLANKNVWRATHAGFLLGLSVYFKESVFLMMILYLIFFVFSFWGMVRIKFIVITILVMGVLLMPWVARNYHVFHEIIPFTTHGGITLYDAVNPDADGGSDYEKFKHKHLVKETEEYAADKAWFNLSIQEIKKDRMRILKLSLEKQKRFWNVFPNFDIGKGWQYYLFGCFYAILFLLAFIGFLLLFVRRRFDILLFSIPIFYFSFVHAIFVGSLRYRMPIETFIIFFSGFTIDFLFKKYFKKENDG